MGLDLAPPSVRGASTFSVFAAASNSGRLCLNQGAYELHELRHGQRPADDDLVVSHLRTGAEIDTVRALRNQIELSHAAADPDYAAHEKKETN